MNNTFVWLSISLFCERILWHDLIGLGIDPFIDGLKRSETLKGLAVEFNYKSGENIRLSLLVAEENEEIITILTDDYFRSFFGALKPSIKKIILPVQGIFLPFPSHTIQYGLYSPRFVQGADQDHDKINTHLSEAMIQALHDEEINEETLVTFGLYINLSLLASTVGNNGALMADIWSSYYPVVSNVADQEFLRNSFQQNRRALMDIAADLLLYADDQPQWLADWKQFCAGMLVKRTPTSKRETIQKIIWMTGKHLGYNSKMKMVLNYTINSILNERVCGNQKKL